MFEPTECVSTEQTLSAGEVLQSWDGDVFRRICGDFRGWASGLAVEELRGARVERRGQVGRVPFEEREQSLDNQVFSSWACCGPILIRRRQRLHQNLEGHFQEIVAQCFIGFRGKSWSLLILISTTIPLKGYV